MSKTHIRCKITKKNAFMQIFVKFYTKKNKIYTYI